MLTPEQLSRRKIGGSDVATILGLNPFKTELELYFEKTGVIPPEDLSENEAVAAGNLLEDGIADLAAWHLARIWNKPVKLRRCNLTLSHPKYDWLTVHIDRDVQGEDRGVEIKNVGYYAARWWGQNQAEDGVPEYHKPQVHTYLLVKGYPAWTVAGYFGGRDLRVYDLERSREWDELIVESTHDFWFNNVLKGVPPDPKDVPAKRRFEVAQRVYPGTTGEYLVADDLGEIVVPNDDDSKGGFLSVSPNRARQMYNVACAKEKAAHADAELLKGSLLLAMGEAAVLSFPDGTTFTRKLVKRKGYTVAASECIRSTFKKPPKAGAGDDDDDA
jgi:putative phage-type endonuclease